jgi:hypothetical protein
VPDLSDGSPEQPARSDLTAILREFPYEPGRVQARIVAAADGRQVVQVRVELGILQMECEGRPDGAPSVLGAGDGIARPLSDPTHAAAARIEAAQVQHRAVAYLALGDAPRALRDAEQVLAVLGRLAAEGPTVERDWAEGARFSALVFRTRAAAAVYTRQGRSRDAVGAVDVGLKLLHVQATRLGIDDQFETLADVRALRTMRDALQPQLPPAQRAELEQRLLAAVRAENYELAAILRDELRRM